MSTEVERGRGLEREGIRTIASDGTSLRQRYTRRRSGGRKASSPPRGRSSAVQVSTRAARRTTSSWCASRRAKPTSGGGRSIVRSPRRSSTRCTTTSLARSPARNSSSSTATPARIPATGCLCASLTSTRGTTCSAAISSSTIRVVRAQAPEFTIIDAPSFKADPGRHGTKSEVVIALNFAQEARAHRRHELRRRDEEVDLHAS